MLQRHAGLLAPHQTGTLAKLVWATATATLLWAVAAAYRGGRFHCHLLRVAARCPGCDQRRMEEDCP